MPSDGRFEVGIGPKLHLETGFATESTVQRSRLRERPLLHGEGRFEIDLRGFHRFMPKPECNHGPVDTRLEQLHGRAVSQAMGGNPLVLE